MGQKYFSKKLPLSHHRYCKKKGWFKRRQMLKALAAEQSTTVSNDTNDESVSCQDSMQLLPDSMDSTFSTGDTLCLQPISIIKGECKNVQKCKDNNLVIEKTSLVDTDRILQHEPKDDTLVIEKTGLVDTDRILQHEPKDDTFVIEKTGLVDTEHILQHESEDDTLVIKKTGLVDTEHILQHESEDDTLVIEKTGLVDTERIQQYEPKEDGIINISFFHEELHRTFDNHARGIECQFKDWKLVNTRHCGFRTQFFYKCNMCHYEANFWSHPKDEKTMDINTAITAGTITTGIGYAQMEEMFAAANVPCMSQKTYIKNREVVLEEFEKTAFENMKKAGELERQLAVERNDVINGYARDWKY
ncbi:uncharacterized protein LOC118646123 [Monomorium pharaonis]|uniref:uncharacterized protein LOC118646123 n=1 Tax=Monomorium pharaonis TaxID=307658 RepID=UPI0017476EA7|nr:uncharacterized protein LOC118646123 [Monomorium pharaonis]